MKPLLVASVANTDWITPELEALLQQDGYCLQPVEQQMNACPLYGRDDPPYEHIVLVDPAWLQAQNQGTERNGHPAGWVENPWLSGICKLKQHPQLAEAAIVVLDDSHALTPGQLDACLHAGMTDMLPRLDHSPQRYSEFRTRLALLYRHLQQEWQTREMTEQLSQLNSELYDRNLLIEKELYGARQLQQSLLPHAMPDEDYPLVPGHPVLSSAFRFSRLHYRSDRLKVSGLYMPCDSLGGDLYDVIPFADGAVGITMADVSGHGVPAGFITALFKSSLYRITHTHQVPNDILFYLNNELAELVKTGDYITGLYCRLLPERNLLEFAGAGHPYPILYRAATGCCERLKENGPPLVWLPGMTYDMMTQPVAPGDKLLLFTDGITEMENPQGELYGEERLEALLQATITGNREGTLPEEMRQLPLLDQLLQQLSDFTRGTPLRDDMSMVLLEFL